MIMDDTMERALGFDSVETSAQRYQYWYDRIPQEKRESVNHAMETMRSTGTVAQVDFPWQHPQLGEVMLCFSGLAVENSDQRCKWEGCCRLLES